MVRKGVKQGDNSNRVDHPEGICPRQELLAMTRGGIIIAPPLSKVQLQPASLDLRLGERCFRMRTSFLPGETESIEQIVSRYGKYDLMLSEDKTTYLERGHIYLMELQEMLDLPQGFFGTINPKSSIGRGDAYTVVHVEGVPRSDFVNIQGRRRMLVECIPLSFDIKVKKGLSLNQLRIGYKKSGVSERELKIIHSETPLMYNLHDKPIPLNFLQFNDDGIDMTVDLQSPIVAYEANDSSLVGAYDLTGDRGSLVDRAHEFWKPISRPSNGELILEKGRFYLLATREKVRFSPTLCGTLRAYDVSSAEGRVHYAGFFDPGFFAPATLEVRLNKTFRIIDGQRICNMQFERMAVEPVDEKGRPIAYGQAVYRSNYQHQQPGPTLGKQFLPAVKK